MDKQREIMAAIYCRLSRDDGGDAESNSIGNQREQLTRYANEHGFIIYSEYVDDGISGTTFERASFKRMIEDIESEKIGIILCKDLSRLGRNNALVAFYTELFLPDHDVRLICVNDAIDTGVGENEIMAFKSVINEYYARDISKKIRSARRTQALRGDFYGALAPYGYMKSPHDKHKLLVDDEAAEIVKRIFQMTADGLGQYQIARRFYEAKIPTPSAYRIQKFGKKGRDVDEDCYYDWSNGAVRGILMNRVYVGDIVNHKQSTKSFKNHRIVRYPESEHIVVEQMHEAIIEKDLFERVQRQIKVKKRDNSLKKPNIFAGLLVCADCGNHLNFHASEHSKEKSGRFICNQYRHTNRHAADAKCTIHSIAYKTLYDLTLEQLNFIITSNLSESDIQRQLHESRTIDAGAKKNLDKLKRRDKELRLIVKKIVEQNALGEISQATFADLYNGYADEQEALTAKIQALESNIVSIDRDKDNAKKFIEIIHKYMAAEELTREMLLDLIEKIVVHEATGNYQHRNRRQVIEFHYRFIGNLQGEKMIG